VTDRSGQGRLAVVGSRPASPGPEGADRGEKSWNRLTGGPDPGENVLEPGGRRYRPYAEPDQRH
jgi:hypothetical protein